MMNREKESIEKGQRCPVCVTRGDEKFLLLLPFSTFPLTPFYSILFSFFYQFFPLKSNRVSMRNREPSYGVHRKWTIAVEGKSKKDRRQLLISNPCSLFLIRPSRLFWLFGLFGLFGLFLLPA